MKTERTARAQAQRVDEEKANRWVELDYFPDRATRGDTIYVKGIGYVWLRGEWKPLGGGVATPTPIVPTAIEPELPYSSEVGDPSSGPQWSGSPPIITVATDSPTTVSFDSIFLANGTNPIFTINLATNSDGTGTATEFQQLNFTIDANLFSLTVDAAQVNVGSIYYRINAEVTGMGLVSSAWTKLTILDGVSSQWSALAAQSLYEGFAKDYNFSTLIAGADSMATYSVELASDASGTAITQSDLDTELTASIPAPGTAIVRFDATGVELTHASANSSVYYRLTLHQADGTTTVNSAWTSLMILNAYVATWGAIPVQRANEGDTLSIDVSSFFIEGAPLTPNANFTVALAGDSVGTAISNVDLDTELTISVDGATKIITVDLTQVDVSLDTNVYFQVRANQPAATASG